MDTNALTWTSLLAHWMDFARTSVALPADAEGYRWRQSVTPIITLQAVTFALGDLARLEHDERALARDKADILISDAAGALREAWGSHPMPETVLEVAADARRALAASSLVGVTELIWPGPGTMEMPRLPDPEPGGTLALMAPGTIVMPGEPVAWWADRAPVEIDGCRVQVAGTPRQVYRQIDADGAITGDLIAPIADALPPGLPLLVPLLEHGEPVGRFTMDADAWLERQRASIGDGEIPVAVHDPA